MDSSENFEQNIRQILLQIGENPEREGLVKTPKRVAKAYQFMCSGYDQNPQEILQEAMFTTDNNEMVLVRDIEFYSLCEHHMLPFFGKAHVAYIPDKKVVGLSKIPRVVNVFARRLQLQEQLTEQIAQAIMDAVSPKGVAVVTQARHMCMEMRGVEKVQSSTLSSALRGEFMKASTRAEFFNLINTPYHKN